MRCHEQGAVDPRRWAEALSAYPTCDAQGEARAPPQDARVGGACVADPLAGAPLDHELGAHEAGVGRVEQAAKQQRVIEKGMLDTTR